MTDTHQISDDNVDEGSDVSLLTVGSVLLRKRRSILLLATAGFSLGVFSGLSAPRYYTSTTTFIPQGSEAAASGLSLAASQLGIRVPTTSASGWGPSMYVELMQSHSLLEPLVDDTVTVAEERNRRVALMDLLEIEGAESERGKNLAVQSLAGLVAPSEKTKLGAVEVKVTTRWPSVSLQLAERLVERVNQFNIETRRSQAMTELKFVEQQTLSAENALRQAEDRLQSFLQRNRSVGSPELSFERDRLHRAVTERQELYTSWLQTREEARIRELRDTPVITVLERPRLPFRGESRRTVSKAMTGGLAGAAIGIVWAFLAHAFGRVKGSRSPEAQEFFRQLHNATPRFLRRLLRW